MPSAKVPRLRISIFASAEEVKSPCADQPGVVFVEGPKKR